MSEKTLQERVERYARWYLTNVADLDVLEDLNDDEDGIRGFIARDREDASFRFVYLSYHDPDDLQSWGTDIAFDKTRERFEHDMVQFYSKDEPREGEVCYAELRVLVLGDDRAIFKFITASPVCVTEVCA